MAADIDLPSDGQITRAYFEALPRPARRWAWELRDGRLRLEHMPITYWHCHVLVAALKYWDNRGHQTAGDQYVADSALMRGEDGRHVIVAHGVVFAAGHQPDMHADTHDAAHAHAIIEVVSSDGGERDAIEKRAAYAELRIPHYWIVRADTENNDLDGLIGMYEPADAEYKLTGTRRVSQLGGQAE